MTGLILSLLYWQLSDFYAFSMPILDSNFYFSAEGGLDFKFLIFIIWSLIFLTLWLIALIDLKTMLIPNGLVLFLSALGALKLFVNDYGLRIKDTGSFLNEYSYLFGDFSSNWLNYFKFSFYFRDYIRFISNTCEKKKHQRHGAIWSVFKFWGFYFYDFWLSNF